jgi:diguanylate cyclase (GGDEF)-like protein
MPVKTRLLKNLLNEVTKKYDELLEEKERIFEKTYEMSITDSLTGLYNRNYVLERLNQELARNLREKNSFSVIIFDLDNFKKINDKYGHLKGDEVLKKVSNIIKNSFREYDIIGRMGGDEFLAIVFENKKNLKSKLNIIREKIESIFPKEDLSVSYGIISIPDDIKDLLNNSLDLEKLMKNIILKADILMYKDKQTRKKGR